MLWLLICIAGHATTCHLKMLTTDLTGAQMTVAACRSEQSALVKEWQTQHPNWKVLKSSCGNQP